MHIHHLTFFYYTLQVIVEIILQPALMGPRINTNSIMQTHTLTLSCTYLLIFIHKLNVSRSFLRVFVCIVSNDAAEESHFTFLLKYI